MAEKYDKVENSDPDTQHSTFTLTPRKSKKYHDQNANLFILISSNIRDEIKKGNPILPYLQQVKTKCL